MKPDSVVDAAFGQFVAQHSATLLHAARLLTGDYHRGEDLCQTVLARLYLRWSTIDQPLAYARTALVRAHIDTTRRRWTGERVTDILPERPDPSGSAAAGSDDRDELRRLLATLAPRERAVIVLRYYCDLSEQDTATTLGLPVGTVKSTCSRALARLRVDARTAS